MWWALRTYIWFAALVVLVCMAAAWIPGWLARAQVPDGYDDVSLGGDKMSGVMLSPPPCRAGQMAAYRIGDGPDDIGFGRVIAVEGDTVEFREGRLFVSGNPIERWDPKSARRMPTGNLGPITIPANHIYVLSDRHQRDSIALGVIKPDVLLGSQRE